jgi:hypothetical protein
MFLNQTSSGHMVEVLSIPDLMDPYKLSVSGRLHYGEETQETDSFDKVDLVFLSGESLPRCWVDPQYRDAEVHRRDI